MKKWMAIFYAYGSDVRAFKGLSPEIGAYPGAAFSLWLYFIFFFSHGMLEFDPHIRVIEFALFEQINFHVSHQ